jgi:hypothetical protein
MLLTIHLCEGETKQWGPELCAVLTKYATNRCRRVGRRFFQIVGAGGAILKVGEVA